MKLSKVVTAVAALSLLAACGQEASDDNAKDSGSDAPKVLETLKPGGISDEWIKWNGQAFEPTTDHPAEWSASVRGFKPGAKVTFIGLSDTIPFGNEVTKSFESAAKEIGLDLKVLNNEFPDAQKPLANAETAITQQSDLVINYNGLQNVYPAILQKFKTAKVPMMTLSFKNPNTPVFGADNATAGEAAAAYMVKYFQDKKWPAADTWVVSCGAEALGPFLNTRISAAKDAVTKALPEIPASNVVTLDCKGSPDETRSIYTDWLTAHPQAKYLLGTAINDTQSVVMANVLKATGRDANAAIVGQSADPAALAVIRGGESKALVSTISFSTAVWGKFMLALAADVLDGKAVPAESFSNMVAVDKSNIDALFPAK